MVRDKFGLGAYDFRKMALICCCDTSMQRASGLAQQRAVSGILHQRMLKEIRRLRSHSLTEQQTRLDDTIQSRCQILLWHPHDRVQESKGELPSYGRSDLCHVLCRAEPIQ